MVTLTMTTSYYKKRQRKQTLNKEFPKLIKVEDGLGL